MSPSHPDRVRQNYCEHDWTHNYMGGIIELDGDRCLKCKMNFGDYLLKYGETNDPHKSEGPYRKQQG